MNCMIRNYSCLVNFHDLPSNCMLCNLYDMVKNAERVLFLLGEYKVVRDSTFKIVCSVCG